MLLDFAAVNVADFYITYKMRRDTSPEGSEQRALTRT